MRSLALYLACCWRSVHREPAADRAISCFASLRLQTVPAAAVGVNVHPARAGSPFSRRRPYLQSAAGDTCEREFLSTDLIARSSAPPLGSARPTVKSWRRHPHRPKDYGSWAKRQLGETSDGRRPYARFRSVWRSTAKRPGLQLHRVGLPAANLGRSSTRKHRRRSPNALGWRAKPLAKRRFTEAPRESVPHSGCGRLVMATRRSSRRRRFIDLPRRATQINTPLPRDRNGRGAWRVIDQHAAPRTHLVQATPRAAGLAPA